MQKIRNHSSMRMKGLYDLDNDLDTKNLENKNSRTFDSKLLSSDF